MTEERQNILEDFYAGDDKTLRVTVWTDEDKTTPKPNLSNAELIGYALFDDDNEVFVRKSSLNGASQVTVVDEPNAIVEIYLLPEDTWYMNGQYRHQMNVVDENGKNEMVMTGKVNIFPAFAQHAYRIASIPAYLSGGT